MIFEPGISTFIFADRPLGSYELSQIKEAGFNLMEIWGSKSHLDFTDPSAVKTIKTALSSLGLKVASYHGPFGEEFNLSSPDEAVRRQAVKAVIKTLEALEELGGERLIIHAGLRIKEGEDRRLLLAKARMSLEEILKAAEKKKKTLAIENMLPGLLADSSHELWGIVNSFSSLYLGICLDTGHINNMAEDLVHATQLFQSRLVTLHVSDNIGQGDSHVVPGEGNINWPEFLAALAKGSYDGPFMYELVKQEDNMAAMAKAYEAYKGFRQIFRENLV